MSRELIITFCLVGLLIVPTLAFSNGSKSNDAILILKNGDILTGELLAKVFELRTPPSLKQSSFKVEDIKMVNFESHVTYNFKIGSHQLDIITLKTGDKFEGFVQNEVIEFKLRTEAGDTLHLKKSEVKYIIFGD